MIIITGAAGFIGSYTASYLSKAGHNPLVLVDDFNRPDKKANWEHIPNVITIDRDLFLTQLEDYTDAECFIHLGARTDTTEFDQSIFDRLNLSYSKSIWNHCTSHQIPLIYASSAATYGAEETNFTDDHRNIKFLSPLNPYGDSKHQFDLWALSQDKKPPFWAGLKFFNVYGPNENHKGRMASVVFHAYHQIVKTGKMNLFESHRPDFKHGQQTRDFIYVDDLVSIIDFLRTKEPESGIYNTGTGNAQTFNELAEAVFKALDLPADIHYIPTPEDIRDKYQYYTQADMSKLRNAGYTKPFKTLEEGADDYVKNFLKPNLIY